MYILSDFYRKYKVFSFCFSEEKNVKRLHVRNPFYGKQQQTVGGNCLQKCKQKMIKYSVFRIRFTVKCLQVHLDDFKT